ncbi:hypothetical protein D0Z70_22475 [Sphingobium terrigena]|uniref:Uncharacterized protein n=1 Tax=Sphingobium terrigena TaxID=2304063 RepID=A0A418YLW8_9SPHN|nr:hypothetical protein D0Z70_22475 [Sphingobium terrigena]
MLAKCRGTSARLSFRAIQPIEAISAGFIQCVTFGIASFYAIEQRQEFVYDPLTVNPQICHELRPALVNGGMLFDRTTAAIGVQQILVPFLKLITLGGEADDFARQFRRIIGGFIGLCLRGSRGLADRVKAVVFGLTGCY